MKKIIIDVSSDAVNNTLNVEVIRRSDDVVVFHDVLEGDFGTAQIDVENLDADTRYKIAVWGATTGTIELSISGDIKAPNPIEKELEETFDKTFFVETNN